MCGPDEKDQQDIVDTHLKSLDAKQKADFLSRFTLHVDEGCLYVKKRVQRGESSK